MKTLTRRTDIYSWGLCVLEMFLGKRLWNLGMLVGGKQVETFLLEKMRAPMSEDMKHLLRHCLKKSPIRRPHDFLKIEENLLRQCEDATGKVYPRSQPQAAIAATASSAATVFDVEKSKGSEDAATKKRGRLPKKAEGENLPQPARESFDPASYNDPANMTEPRRTAIDGLCAEMNEDYERGDLSREEMLESVKGSYDKPSWVWERASLRELYGLYKPIELLAIDDEGDYHDSKECESYTVNGEPFCCCHPMDTVTKGKFKCRFCGSTYKKPSSATVPKKRGRPPKSESEKTLLA
jgi:serine/threonine protein kinase